MTPESTSSPLPTRGHSLRGRPLVFVPGAQGRRFDPDTFTVQELFDVYTREHLPSKAQTTIYQYRRLLAWIAESLGPLRLVDLTPAVLRQWRDAVLAMGYQPQTVHRYCHLLSGPLTFAVQVLEVLPDNPMHKVTKPPTARGRVRFLSDDERTRLLAACRQSRNPKLYPLVLLALSTGCRKTELLTLRWEHVDLARGVIRLQRTKNGERRGVPLTGPVVPLLTAMRALHEHQRPGHPLVFPGSGAGGNSQFEHAWNGARRRAGLADFRFHDLRHTAASWLAMNGASLLEIAEILGHKTLQMVQRYVHVSAAHTTTIAAKMTTTMLGDMPQPQRSPTDGTPEP